jgi:predicted O-methyltransferase YrrM
MDTESFTFKLFRYLLDFISKTPFWSPKKATNPVFMGAECRLRHMIGECFERVGQKLISINRSMQLAELWSMERRLFPLSSELFDSFGSLKLHQGASGIFDVHFTDAELEGAICMPALEANILHKVALMAKPCNALEIGSYIGWSTAHLARALPRLVCIDPFIELSSDTAWASDVAYERFRENLRRANVLEKVYLIRDTSPAGLKDKHPESGWDLVFIDGYHMEGAPMRDFRGIVPYLSRGATVILHDAWCHCVRDVVVAMMRASWTVRILDTPNYLTIAWPSPQIPHWADTLFEELREPPWYNVDAARHRILIGLDEMSLREAVHYYDENRLLNL